MDWQRTTMGRLVCDLGAYRGVVERIPEERAWTAHVEARQQTYTAGFDYPTMYEAQQWVERKIEELMHQRAQ